MSRKSPLPQLPLFRLFRLRRFSFSPHFLASGPRRAHFRLAVSLCLIILLIPASSSSMLQCHTRIQFPTVHSIINVIDEGRLRLLLLLVKNACKCQAARGPTISPGGISAPSRSHAGKGPLGHASKASFTPYRNWMEDFDSS